MTFPTTGAAQSAPFVFPVQWITNDLELHNACQRWMQCEAIALDTEFERVRTFWPILALIQLCDGESIYLIDPLKITNWQAFAQVLTAPNIEKVMHAAGEDLEAFHHSCDALLQPLFDTQVALSYAGFGHSVGLASVVKERYGVDLSKDTARTDWLARPLSDEQVTYAVTDVVYLLDMYSSLKSQLSEDANLHYVQEDGDTAAEKVVFSEPEALLYRRLKQASLLRGQALAIAQALAFWREQEAKQNDISRNHILKDDAIIALAQKPPKTWNEFADLNLLHPRTMRLYGKNILQLIENAKATKSADWPLPVSRLMDIHQGRQIQEAMLDEVKAWSKDNALQAEQVFSKRALETLLVAVVDRLAQAPFVWRGWRKKHLAVPLKAVLEAHQITVPAWWM